MNEGVKILIERMKTNPEEFIVSEGYPYQVGSGSKWHGLIESHKLYLSPEDNKVLEEALNGLMQQRFTERVMKELLAPEEDDDMGKWFSAQKIGTPRGGATLGAYSNTAHATIQLQQIQTEHNAHLRTHLDRHRELLKMGETVEVRKKAVLRKPHETLFGKLKNYLHTDT